MFLHFLPFFASLASKCLLVLFCMLGHELGHILVARYFHVSVKKIGFNWMGMYIQRARTVGWPEISVCMAGAAMNLTLALLFWNINNWFALCNLIFGLVNILPISHSDGSHAWEAVRAMNQPASSVKKNSSHAIV
jgi:Zn-dependent protease